MPTCLSIGEPPAESDAFRRHAAMLLFSMGVDFAYFMLSRFYFDLSQMPIRGSRFDADASFASAAVSSTEHGRSGRRRRMCRPQAARRWAAATSFLARAATRQGRL